MSIKVSFNGATILRPGAYSKTTVNLYGGYPLSDTGIVGIVGEAEGGAPGSTVGVGVQSYNITQISNLVANYVSGPIVDVARALVAPSRDSRVTNATQVIRVYKTNNSAKASNTVYNMTTAPASILYDIDSANYGLSGNLVNFYLSEGSQPDDEGSVISDVDIAFPLTVSNGSTMDVIINGVTYTLTIAVAPAASIILNQTQLISVLNGTAVTVGADTATPTWAALRPTTASAVGTTKIQLQIDPTTITSYANQFEYALMTVTSAAFPTALGLTLASTINATTLAVTKGGLGPVRGVRGNRVFTILQNNTIETIDENENEIYLTIFYTGAGTPASLQVVKVGGKKHLTTTCVGATSDNLDINLEDYSIKELVDYINNLDHYVCLTNYYNAATRNAAWIDWYGAIDMLTLPAELKGCQLEIENNVNTQSQLVTLELKDEVYGALETITAVSKRYLSGGTRGLSTNSNFQSGFDALLSTRCNTVLPCISRDASADITDGLTDPSSTYTIASVHGIADTHCRTASNTKNRSERNCYVGYKGTFANSKVRAKAMNSEFTTMAIQDVSFIDVDGNLTIAQPHVLAAMMAGIQAGTEVGEPITYKYVNTYGISHTDYDPKQDVDDAIEAGLCVVEEPDGGGYRIVVGNTTYGVDANFVFNRISVLEVAHYVAYNLRSQLESIFVGTGRQRVSTSTQSIFNVTAGILTQFNGDGLLVPDQDNSYRGYKDLVVSMDGNTAHISVTITPLQGIDFLLADITLDNIRDQVS